MFPTSHLIMFGGMVFLHLFGMPWFMLDKPGHFRVSRGQIYMACVMGLYMVFLEAAMHPMPLWAWVLSVGFLVCLAFAIRHQWFIRDVDYLQEMIPHHSMAIFTSRERLTRKDIHPDVRHLAGTILTSQETEIQQMSDMVDRISSD